MSDIDECLQEIHDCNMTSTSCVNLPGTYTCSCLTGFYGPAGSRSCEGIYSTQMCHVASYRPTQLGIMNKGQYPENGANKIVTLFV